MTYKHPIAPENRLTSKDWSGRRFRAFTRSEIDRIPQLQSLPVATRQAMQAVSAVLPFRVNEYVLEELIDWSDIPNDPIYQLTFPQPGMLGEDEFETMLGHVRRGSDNATLTAQARPIQASLNPHPAGQLELNVPQFDGESVEGIQHKYRETVLFFPSAGQTCHAYCTYCFRWAQFVGIEDLRMAARQSDHLVRYLQAHTEVEGVLITGGDPMIMKTKVLRRYVEPLLDPALEHVRTIRIGTKAPAYWPQRFVTDDDADDFLRLIDEARAAGKRIAIMAHYSHPRELSTDMAQRALERIQSAGAVVRCQAPLIRHVNDSSDVWTEMWRRQVELGAVPYYMFVERDTGAKRYFEVPLARALSIFDGAYRRTSGLARTVRGPSLSTTPGKIVVDGTATVAGERVFVLKFLQARNPDWVGRHFFAHFDRHATWLDDLRPAFGERRFFFEDELAAMGPTRSSEPDMVPRARVP